MTNKKLKRKIAAALSIAIATTMVTTAVPVEFGGVVVEAATAEHIKITMESKEMEVTDEMREKMYQCAGEDNVDSTLFTETDGKLIKLTLNLETPESEMGAFGYSIGYDIKKAIPVAFLRKSGSSFRNDSSYYKYDISASQINNSRTDIEDEEGKKYVRITGATADLIYDTGSIGIFYFWVPSTTIGKVGFELYNYNFNGDNGETIELEEGTEKVYSYDTGRVATVVTFNANGGTIDGKDSVSTEEVAEGTQVDIPLQKPTWGNKVFLGWSKDKEAEKGITEGKVTAEKDVIYYAIWGKSPLPENVAAKVTGTPIYNGSLKAMGENVPEDAGTPTYQWYRAEQAIEGATKAEYKPVKEDIGQELSVIISYQGYTGQVKAKAEGKVAKAPAPENPVIVEADCVAESEQITVKKIENALYSINGGEFTENNVFTGLTPKTTYEISVKYAETETYLESEAITISVTTKKASPKAEQGITASCVYGTTLGAIKPVGNMVYGDKNVAGTFEWQDKKANEIYPTAGENIYKAIFKPEDTENYVDSVEVDVKVSCEAKKINVKAISSSAIYGQVLPAFDFEVQEEDLVESDTKEDLKLVLQTDAPEKPDAGEYAITKKECGNANYDVTVEENILTIEKAKPEITITNTKETEGSVTGAKATITPESRDAKAVIEYKAGDNDAWTEKVPTTVGTYTVRAYLPEETAGKNLIAIPSGSAVTAKYIIEKKASSGNQGGSTGGTTGGNTGGTTGGNTGSNTGGTTAGNIGSIGGGGSSTVVTPPADNTPSKDNQNTETPKDDTGNKNENNNPKDDDKNNTGNNNVSSDDKKEDSNKQNNKTTKTKKVKLNKKKASIKVGKTIKLKVLNTKKKVTWSSNKPKIAKVNQKGKITALKPGKAVIKAKIKNGKTLKFKLTIKKASKKKK